VLAQLDKWAKAHNVSRNEAFWLLIARGLSVDSAPKPYMADLGGKSLQPTKRLADICTVRRTDAKNERSGAGIVAGLSNLQFGPVKRTGPLLKKAAK
jgi:hypothetical protein